MRRMSELADPSCKNVLRRLRVALCAAALCAALPGWTATPTAKSAAPSQRAGVPVLVYHEVVTDFRAEGDTVIALANFTEQMQLLADEGFVTVSVDELARFMKGEINLPAKAIVLTFEDGWKSALNATPVLERLGFKASFWIITSNGIGGDYLGWSPTRASRSTRTPSRIPGTSATTWSPGSRTRATTVAARTRSASSASRGGCWSNTSGDRSAIWRGLPAGSTTRWCRWPRKPATPGS
jgi:hypothetical protein